VIPRNLINKIYTYPYRGNLDKGKVTGVVRFGDFHRGNLYRFTLNENRTDLQLGGRLTDNIANNIDELEDIILGQGFGGITDIEIGPDGNIYVLSLYQGGSNCDALKPQIACVDYDSSAPGTIFKIVSKDDR
jgi:hypothetical protein